MSGRKKEAGDDEGEGRIEEVDSSDRWIRYNESLGSGSFKVAYKGFDKKLGIEIAWNKVNLFGRHLTEEDRERLHREVDILKSLDNPYIIKCYGAWRDQKTSEMNFITELFTSGTLRDFRRKHQGICVRDAVCKWGKNILKGLAYMHTQNPPIIHRDLKCDNIFINGHSGEVKIADLGLAALVENSQRAQTVIGTPEFMAPELYDEHYDERVDIYAFGMVMLELATLRFPYDELRNPAQIFKAVSSGRMPNALLDVEDEEVLAIIRACINHDYRKRPSALELLELPFFQMVDVSETLHEIQVEGCLKEGCTSTVHLQLTLPKAGPNGKKKLVKFDFEVGDDTAVSVADEMSEALGLNPGERDEISAKIDYRVKSVMMQRQESSTSRMKKSKSHAALVRVPVAIGDNMGVSVVRKLDNNREFRIEVCAPDRKNLLWELTNSLHELPLRVTNASISTTDSGVAMDAFDVCLEEGVELTAQDIQEHLEPVICT